MTAFYFFLAGKQLADVATGPETAAKLDVDKLAPLGLAKYFEDASEIPGHTIAQECQRDPMGGDQSGLMLYAKPLTRMDGAPDPWPFDIDVQTWQETSVKGVQIGYKTGDLPEPLELVRRTMCNSLYFVEDTAGRKWLVPVARSPDPKRITLPCAFSYTPTYQLTSQYRPQYRELAELALHAWNKYNLPPQERPAAPKDPHWEIKAAVLALEMNYRLCPAVYDVLRDCDATPLATQQVKAILECMIDQEMSATVTATGTKKKTDGQPPSGTSSSTTGDSEGSEATNQPSES